MNDMFSVLGLQSSQRNSQRIARLERKVDFILKELGLEYEGREEDSFPGLDEVKDLLRQGRKIQAIKVYRQRTGVGLREAKEAVERIEIETGY
jgi:ribosomal protein L7/L12